MRILFRPRFSLGLKVDRQPEVAWAFDLVCSLLAFILSSRASSRRGPIGGRSGAPCSGYKLAGDDFSTRRPAGRPA
jgi:hypothetical protein